MAGRKVFSAGEVLLASDVNNYLMDQAVMVFAGTAARSSALPLPTEGMVTYLSDTNTLASYNGSTWSSLGALPNLQLVKTQTIGTAVSSVAVTDAFSASYENYLIMVNGGVASTALSLQLTFGASATGYYRSLRFFTYAGTTSNQGDQNDTRFKNVIYADTVGFFGMINVYSPYLSVRTSFDSTSIQPSTTGAAGYSGGFHNVAASYTDFTLTCSTGNITGGTIAVYGYGI